MAQGSSDGLWRWLVGGLVGGAVLLGLLVAAYAIGYHRGEHHGRPTTAAPATTAPPAPAAPATTAAATTAPATTAAPPPSSAQAVARGRKLYESDACAGCHTLDGSASSGPTFKGLAGSRVALADGSTVTADDAYLERSITDPDAQIVKGYQSGIMSAAVSGFDFGAKAADVSALVAFIDAQT